MATKTKKPRPRSGAKRRASGSNAKAAKAAGIPNAKAPKSAEPAATPERRSRKALPDGATSRNPADSQPFTAEPNSEKASIRPKSTQGANPTIAEALAGLDPQERAALGELAERGLTITEALAELGEPTNPQQNGQKSVEHTIAENPEIRRAAERANVHQATGYVAPWPGDPHPGRTLLESLRASEWPGDHAEILRRFARDFDAEAGKLGGNEVADPYRAAIEHVMTMVGEQLAKACDALSEDLASYTEGGGGDDFNVRQALLALWRIRWELGSEIDGRPAEFAVKRAVERVKERNGAAEVAS